METLPTSVPPASPEKQPQFTIDLVARSTAPILLLIYGIGFVILGFHDAKYGVVQFSPFRARIFLVGFVFAAFVALAVAAQHYGFHNFGLTSLDQVFKDSDVKRRPYRETILAAAFILTATAISNSLAGY
jgi:hypothetical protein